MGLHVPRRRGANLAAAKELEGERRLLVRLSDDGGSTLLQNSSSGEPRLVRLSKAVEQRGIRDSRSVGYENYREKLTHTFGHSCPPAPISDFAVERLR